ncbi:hypothetical protein AKG08_05915 [Achromobacter piechaudii]|uniref:Uncharacterized protein n=1 Tax=Achromobacter piechaudii TaxID=72556 RepID=A0ABM8KUG0_9BURK|nr:hypothetical protein [Achromobacter piechaudii]KNY11220.1 hypothetical protein AKG08_05915 [Achromobacter piechaudii]CAB3661576.1 hypothetical protein LMG1873_00613 [Achromobacter piechaudii]CAB3825574.1 hypothetical protein LMG2828_00689 [Achromobacter piechaudii]CAB3945066.1 hypothetical protein LMG6103_01078 [Achromobacter piechaudii]
MQSHPLTQNPWSIETDPELGVIPLAHLHHIDRTRHAIEAIARLVGNSAFEPAATGEQPLDAWTVAALMGGVQSLCDHFGTLTEVMLEQARTAGRDVGPDCSCCNAPASMQ